MLRFVTYHEFIGSLSDDLKGWIWTDRILPLSYSTVFGEGEKEE